MAANSTVEIVNMALVMLGADVLAALDDGSKAGTLMDALFDTERDAALQAYEWNFATKRRALALDATAPVYGYGYAYQLPSDYLRVLEVYPTSRYEIEGRKLLADLSSISIRYTYRVTSPTEWSATFKSVFAARLAWQASLSLTESVGVHDRVARKYENLLLEARTVDAQEGSIQSAVGPGANVLIDVRRGGPREWWDDSNHTLDFGQLGS